MTDIFMLSPLPSLSSFIIENNELVRNEISKCGKNLNGVSPLLVSENAGLG